MVNDMSPCDSSSEKRMLHDGSKELLGNKFAGLCSEQTYSWCFYSGRENLFLHSSLSIRVQQEMPFTKMGGPMRIIHILMGLPLLCYSTINSFHEISEEAAGHQPESHAVRHSFVTLQAARNYTLFAMNRCLSAKEPS